MASPAPSSLRFFAALFAVIIGLQAIWIVAAELMRPSLPYFPISKIEAADIVAHQNKIELAAYIGWPRGNLWVDHAISETATTVSDIANGQKHATADEHALKTAKTAAALEPTDARIWVLIAALQMGSPPANSPTIAQLKMSYYTSPYNEPLFPFRVQIIAQSSILNDDELQSFAAYEIGMIVRDRPELKSSVLSAYRNGTAAGRHLIEQAVTDKDMHLLEQLREIPQ